MAYSARLAPMLYWPAMTDSGLAQQRLLNQRLSGAPLEQPADVVRWFGAVQAQDYAGAKWALALRTADATDADVEQVFGAGEILRTHVLRPTWHFVTATDIRWMLALTAPRVHAAAAYQYRRYELDEPLFPRTHAALEKGLQGGKQLTRAELSLVLQQAGILTDELRLTHLVMQAELEGVICSGPRRGKQFTYALLAERAPQARTLARDAALAKLTRRYFTSHGPATLRDYVWWSGLTMTDAKAGLSMVQSQLSRDEVAGATYWRPTSAPPVLDPAPLAHLLPSYDEYTVGFTDRSAIFDARHTSALDSRDNSLLTNVVVIDGEVVGTWKRTLTKDAVVIAPKTFAPPAAFESHALAAAVQRYGRFLGLPAVLNQTDP